MAPGARPQDEAERGSAQGRRPAARAVGPTCCARRRSPRRSPAGPRTARGRPGASRRPGRSRGAAGRRPPGRGGRGRRARAGPRRGRPGRRAPRCPQPRPVQRQRAAQQRAPGQLDDDAVRDASELRRQVPRPRPRRTSRWAGRHARRPRGTTGRLGHGGGAGVDADDEPGRVRRQRRPARSGRRRCRGRSRPGRCRPVEWRVSRRPPRGRARPITVRMPGPYAIGPDAATAWDRAEGAAEPRGRSKPRGPHLHSGRCPSSRSAPTSGCPRRSTRGIRAPGTSRSTSPAWSRPRGPGRSRSTSAARRCPGCRARTSSTSAWRPTRTRSRRSPTRCSRSGSSGRAGSLPSRRPGP